MEIAVVVSFLCLAFAEDIREFFKQKHIEKVIAELPASERTKFVAGYLKEQTGINV